MFLLQNKTQFNNIICSVMILSTEPNNWCVKSRILSEKNNKLL